MSQDSNQDILRKLRSEVVFIREAWNYYDSIYRKNENVAIWQESGVTGFFEILQRLLSSEIVLRLARLFDPANSKAKGKDAQNIVLKRACGGSEELLKEYGELETIVDREGGIRECRHKLISHLDEVKFMQRASYSHPEIPELLYRIEKLLIKVDPSHRQLIRGTVSTPADELMLILRQYNRSRFP